VEATERLDLRPWTLDDVEAFHDIWGDPDVIWWGHSRSPAESREVLVSAIEACTGLPDGLRWFAVIERESGRVAGNVFLRPCSYGDGLELGYHFARAFQNRGYATEASEALIAFAFRAGYGRVVAIVVPDNAPSQRVVRKLGMRKTGTVVHGGLLHDVFEVGLGDR